MLKILAKLFSNDSSKYDLEVEQKYFIKYNSILNQQNILKLLEEYKTGVIVFEPIRKTINAQSQANLYEKIDNSSLLTYDEKFETIIGLMMIFDGSFPSDVIVSRLGKVFGREFMDTITQKRNEFKNEIAVKRLIKYLKNK